MKERRHTHTHTQVALTIHLALVRQDDLPAAAGGVDGQGLLEALLDVRAPHPLRVVVHGLVRRVTHPLHVLGRALAAAPAAGINGGAGAFQAEAWTRLGRDLEFPINKHKPPVSSPVQSADICLQQDNPQPRHTAACWTTARPGERQGGHGDQPDSCWADLPRMLCLDWGTVLPGVTALLP